jgi:hypothetical protein
MPLKSEAQRKWMWANDPAMAERWEAETPKGKKLPKKVKPKPKAKTRRRK